MTDNEQQTPRAPRLAWKRDETRDYDSYHAYLGDDDEFRLHAHNYGDKDRGIYRVEFRSGEASADIDLDSKDSLLAAQLAAEDALVEFAQTLVADLRAAGLGAKEDAKSEALLARIRENVERERAEWRSAKKYGDTDGAAICQAVCSALSALLLFDDAEPSTGTEPKP